MPTGTVTFEVRKNKKHELTLGTVALGRGEAALVVKSRKVHKKSITIAYGGDADFLASTSTSTTSTPVSLIPTGRIMVGPFRCSDEVQARMSPASCPRREVRRGAADLSVEGNVMSCDTSGIARSHGTSRSERGSAMRARPSDRHRLRPALVELEGRRLLSTITVTSLADTMTGGVPTTGTLRRAVEQANAATGASTIDFDLTVFAAPQTITLMQGQLELSNTRKAETIAGPAAGVTIGAGGLSRVFQVEQWCHGDALGPDDHRRQPGREVERRRPLQ